MNWTKSLSLAFILVMLASCGNDEGTAEKAGKAVDDTVESMADAVEEMDGEGAMEEAGEMMEGDMSAVKDSTSDAMSGAKSASQDAMDAAKDSASDALEAAKSSGKDMMDEAKAKYGDQLADKAEEAERNADEALSKD
jgi:hypothetical protein